MTDREFDRAVAEALGYTIGTRENQYYNYTLLAPDTTPVEQNWWSTADDAWDDACPEFSTDIAAAFMALDEVRRRGLWWTLEADTDGFGISIIQPARDPKLPDWGQALNEWTGEEKTAAAAIAKAVVKALGEHHGST